MIPKRSVENRLNSPFCKTYPQTKICQPDYDPSAVEMSTQANPKPISVAPSTDLATKLQDQAQKGSNAQMNQLLQPATSVLPATVPMSPSNSKVETLENFKQEK